MAIDFAKWYFAFKKAAVLIKFLNCFFLSQALIKFAWGSNRDYP